MLWLAAPVAAGTGLLQTPVGGLLCGIEAAGAVGDAMGLPLAWLALPPLALPAWEARAKQLPAGQPHWHPSMGAWTTRRLRASGAAAAAALEAWQIAAAPARAAAALLLRDLQAEWAVQLARGMPRRMPAVLRALAARIEPAAAAAITGAPPPNPLQVRLAFPHSCPTTTTTRSCWQRRCVLLQGRVQARRRQKSRPRCCVPPAWRTRHSGQRCRPGRGQSRACLQAGCR